MRFTRQISLPRFLHALKSNTMALHSPDALGVQIYKKVGEGFKNFPSKISLALTGNINLAVKQVSVDNGDTPKSSPKSDERSSTAEEEEVGPLSHLLCRLNKSPSPELIQKCAEVDQQCAEEWGLRVGRIAGMSPELRQTLESEEMPTRMRERNDVFRQFGLEGRMEYQSFEDLDMKNLPDYDPDQEYDVYEYSSDPRLEPPDPFGLGRLLLAASDSASQKSPGVIDEQNLSALGMVDQSSDVSLPKRGDEFNKEAENPLKAQSAGADAAGEFSASETRTSQQWEFMCSSRATSHKDFTSDLSFIPNPSTYPC